MGVVAVSTKAKPVIQKNLNNEVINTYSSITKASKITGIKKSKIIRCCQKIIKEGDGYKWEFQNPEDNIIPPNMSIIKCTFCGSEFVCENFRIKKHNEIFCSKKCEAENKKSNTSLNCICEICNKKFHLKPYHKSRYNHHYCSRKCHSIAKIEYMKGEKNHQYGLKGEKNSSWLSNERISVYGYRMIRNLEHPFANCDGFVFEHRLVAEKYLLYNECSIEIEGMKYLSQQYVVHHLDFNRLNNNKSNLRIMKRGEHTALHMSLENKKNMEDYCNKNSLDFNKVISNHKNNKKYKYKSTVRNGGFGSTDKAI